MNTNLGQVALRNCVPCVSVEWANDERKPPNRIETNFEVIFICWCGKTVRRSPFINLQGIIHLSSSSFIQHRWDRQKTFKSATNTPFPHNESLLRHLDFMADWQYAHHPYQNNIECCTYISSVRYEKTRPEANNTKSVNLNTRMIKHTLSLSKQNERKHAMSYRVWHGKQ